MVVAHPDDESLWGAGMLLRKSGWTVISCSTPLRDPERGEKFKNACALFNADYVLMSQPEQVGTRLNLDNLDLSKYDMIVTHNRDGEYSNAHHKQVHEYIVGKWPEKTICFGYRQKNSSVRDFEIELTPDECKKKMAAIQCYDNIGSSNRPTWVMLMETFAHRFDLWREPYEFVLRAAPVIAAKDLILDAASAFC